MFQHLNLAQRGSFKVQRKKKRLCSLSLEQFIILAKQVY